MGAAETLAAPEGIDEGKGTCNVATLLFGIAADLILVVDSKDLFTSISTQRDSVDRSTHPIVNTTGFEYETGGVDELLWIPGSFNLADPGTITESPLVTLLQLLMHNGVIPLGMSRAE